MSYNPLTDFLALLRSTGGGVRTERIPGLDYVVSALARAGLITLFVGQTAPTVNQSTTVWFQPASPSWTAEGQVFLWNPGTSSFQTATPTLWSDLIAGPFVSLIPAPATLAPVVDGTAAVGTSLLYARQDHVHPTDTSRAPLVSPVFTGTPQAPTAALGDSSLLLATTAFVIANGGLPPPIGSILPYAAATAPNANWAIANGAAFSRTGATLNLFNAIGITFGSGDGVTTANLPDLRGRVVAGVDAGANRLTTATMTSQALAGINNGASGETQLLTVAQMPAHAHGVTDPGHAHNISVNAAGSGTANVAASPAANVGTAVTQSGGTGITTQNNGSGGAHANVQPTMQLQYIIRVS